MNASAAPTIPYAKARERLAGHAVRSAEIPVEHALSLPLPTLRWAEPAFACFAGPALRRPGQPQVLGAPDRWWAVAATRPALIAYNLSAAVPFAADLPIGAVTAGPATRSVAQLREDLTVIEGLLDELAPAFFAGEAGDDGARAALVEHLVAYLPVGTLPWYRGLAPDFFSWLEATENPK